MVNQARLDVEDVSRYGLIGFVRKSWSQVEPAPYQENWHHPIVCRYLEDLYYGKIRNLLIEIPPGCTKSLISSVLFPAWIWSMDPSFKTISVTYSRGLCLRDARRHRDLVNSDWYQARWPNGSRVPYQNTHAAAFFKSAAKGFRFSTSTGGELTGHHANVAICDDLLKVQSALGSKSETLTDMDVAWDFFTKVLPTRLLGPDTRRLLIQQRLHEKDVAGRWIKENPDLTILCLPMEYELDHEHVCPDDPRTEPGELLWPEYFSAERVKELKRELGPIHAAAQLQQRPSPIGGAILQRNWFGQFWDRLPKRVVWYQFWDMTFKGKPTSDFVVGQVWAFDPRTKKAYFIDEVRDRWTFRESKQALRQLTASYPKCGTKALEDAANAAAIEDDLKDEIPGIVLQSHEGGTLARTEATAGYWEAGDIYLPRKPWIGDWIDEHVSYRGSPAGTDDRVSASSLALMRFFRHGHSSYQAAMDAAAEYGYDIY